MGLIAEKYSTALCKGKIKIKLCLLFTADSAGYRVIKASKNRLSIEIYILFCVLLKNVYLNTTKHSIAIARGGPIPTTAVWRGGAGVEGEW